MSINTVTHLNLRGDARAALEFYQSVFGGDLVAITYRDAHNILEIAEADQIMWGQVTSGSGFRIMAYDVPSSLPWNQGEAPFFVSVRGKDVNEITVYWERLSAQAVVVADLAPAAWAPLYGMLKDQFGITWVLDVMADHDQS
jgi:PhnB protein